MAKVVLGLGTSHSPMLSTPPDVYPLHAERDMANPELLGPDGEMYTFEELVARYGKRAEKVTMDKWQARHEASQRAIDKVGEVLAEAQPDAVVVVGDDQEEFFFDDNRPAISIFWGDHITNRPHDFSKLPPSFRPAAWAWYAEQGEDYACVPELGEHIIQRLIDEEFDLAHTRVQGEDLSVGHAFSFVARRVMKDKRVPMVPVMLNTYYPPNQPTASRCYRFGQAVRRAIDAWDSDKRVVVMASGGLSHFVVLEDFDHMMIDAMKDKDVHTLTGQSEKMFQSGTSEIKNWIATAGALEDRQFELIEYVPGYRSSAGTGGGWTWAVWK